MGDSWGGESLTASSKESGKFEEGGAEGKSSFAYHRKDFGDRSESWKASFF